MPISERHQDFKTKGDEDISPSLNIPVGKDHWYKMRVVDIYDRYTKKGDECYVQKSKLVDIDAKFEIFTYYIIDLEWSHARLENLYRNWGLAQKTEPVEGRLFDALLKEEVYMGKKKLVIDRILQWTAVNDFSKHLSALQQEFPDYDFAVPAYLKNIGTQRQKPPQESKPTLLLDDDIPF